MFRSAADCFTTFKLNKDYFSSKHKFEEQNSSLLRLLYYPPSESLQDPTNSNNNDIRAGAHSDYGSITLLFQVKSNSIILLPLEILVNPSTTRRRTLVASKFYSLPPHRAGLTPPLQKEPSLSMSVMHSTFGLRGTFPRHNTESLRLAQLRKIRHGSPLPISCMG